MLIPRSVEDVTPQWLTQVLVGSGVMPVGDRVTSVQHEPVGVGVGLVSQLHRVSYGSCGGREGSVVVKLAAETLHRRSAEALGMYRREVAFYRDLAGVVPMRTPRLHLAEAAEGSTDFVLVVEDLGGLAPGDQLAGLGVLQAGAAVDAVGRLHAWGWEDRARLDDLCDRFPLLRNETTSAMYPSYFEAGWANYLEHVEHEPSAVLALVAERWAAALPWLLDELAEPSTLCHGDYRADNLFFEADGSVVAVDFQLVHQGCGISDVAYLVSQGLGDAHRGDYEALVRRYCLALRATGIDYPWPEAWRQYRIAVLFHLVAAVAATLSWPSLGARGRRLVLRLVDRSGRAIEETDAVSLLPS